MQQIVMFDMEKTGKYYIDWILHDQMIHVDIYASHRWTILYSTVDSRYKEHWYITKSGYNKATFPVPKFKIFLHFTVFATRI